MRNGKINEHFSNHQQTQPPLQGEELCGKSPRVQPEEFWPQCISAMVIIISQQPCVPPGIALFPEQKPKMDEELITPICLPCLCIFFFFSKSKGIKIYKKLLASKFRSIGKFGAISLTVFPFLLRPSDDACWERLQRPHCFPSHHKYWLACVGEISHQWPKKKQLFNLGRLRESREYF